MSELQPAPPRGLRRGVYVLPTLLTVGNMFFGFLSVVKTFQGDFGPAAFFLFIAAVCDALDGRVARLANATSEFDEQYDSLADVVSFGFAPAMLAWRWGLADLERWGFAVGFLFLVCGSMRLARFNIMVHRVDKRWFVGLPIPAGAGVIAAIVNYAPEPLPDDPAWQVPWAVIVVAVSLLMVSTIRYRSFKDIDLRRRKPLLTVLLIAIAFALLLADFKRSLAAVAVLYALSGPIARLPWPRGRGDRPVSDVP